MIFIGNILNPFYTKAAYSCVVAYTYALNAQRYAKIFGSTRMSTQKKLNKFNFFAYRVGAQLYATSTQLHATSTQLYAASTQLQAVNAQLCAATSSRVFNSNMLAVYGANAVRKVPAVVEHLGNVFRSSGVFRHIRT